MSKNLIANTTSNASHRAGALSCRLSCLAAAAALGAALCIAVSGCQSPDLPPIYPIAEDTNATNSIVLHEGDVLQIKFPGAPEMDSVQAIRADGKITILNAGEVKVSGLSPADARDVILTKAAPQLKVKDVSVSVQSSAFIVYVTGAVLKPGKLNSDRPLSVLQAVMEAGIDPEKSNLKRVKVIRTDASAHYGYKVFNLKDILDGVAWRGEPFTLKPYDIIVVPEKFTWF
jgi:protein involved in polysaccharide export with SLBB domain